MIKLFLLVAALVAGLVVGPMFAGNQGYVLISAAGQTLEMSLTTLIILVVFLFGALFVLEWILKKVFSMTGATAGWFSGRKVRKARRLTQDGMVKLLEGNWRQAEKLISRGAALSDSPMLSYIAAADAAQHNGNIGERDRYLQLAAESKGDTLAVSLTRARLQFRQGQYEEAHATLQELKNAHPRNPLLLGLQKDVFIKLEEWRNLLNLLPTLKKTGLINDEEAADLEIKAECGTMAYIARQNGSDGLLAHWNGLSRASRQRPELLSCLIKQLSERKADSEAYVILRDALKKNQSEELIALIPDLNLPDYHPAILRLQDLLRYDERNATTHSALGQLLMREKKWPEARTHLERALELRPDASDYASLVTVLEQLNDTKAASEVSRAALQMALPDKV